MNEKLALSDDILMKIEKPARYIGNEVNAVVKDLNNIDVRFCMCFPDVYEIGMSHRHPYQTFSISSIAVKARPSIVH